MYAAQWLDTSQRLQHLVRRLQATLMVNTLASNVKSCYVCAQCQRKDSVNRAVRVISTHPTSIVHWYADLICTRILDLSQIVVS